MGIIETLSAGAAAAALLAFAVHLLRESQQRPIRKEVRIDEHERDIRHQRRHSRD
ncbi:hypothetical protein [Litchfieldella xinjiangensis]|uniref:hypothetical protein n=1 Tax=Litchfieldella xinjiangensis TaxID=1166948 RepID=UPI000AE0DBF9|nr:hypothetical protein [Halomonas xinjiangensis]